MLKGSGETGFMAHGLTIWNETYGAGRSLEEARAIVYERTKRFAEDVGWSQYSRLRFAVEWLHGGQVTLSTSHRFGAALMASQTVGDDLLSDLRLPAHAFRIEVPNGLLCSEDPAVEYGQLNVFVSPISETDQSFILEEGVAGTYAARTPYIAMRASARKPLPDTLSELLEDSDKDVAVDMAPFLGGDAERATEVHRRLDLLARRLVTGLLLTYAHTTNWRDLGSASSGKKRDPRGPPPHRCIFVGRPITVDARPALADYVNAPVRGYKKRSPPQFQSLVRGHHKRQVIGPLRSGRKAIWIEPYWRGPEEAPILARSKHYEGLEEA